MWEGCGRDMGGVKGESLLSYSSTSLMAGPPPLSQGRSLAGAEGERWKKKHGEHAVLYMVVVGVV